MISMTTAASDVLAVRLMQKEAGVKEHLRVVPLFETKQVCVYECISVYVLCAYKSICVVTSFETTQVCVCVCMCVCMCVHVCVCVCMCTCVGTTQVSNVCAVCTCVGICALSCCSHVCICR